jgi:hypothetical protein
MLRNHWAALCKDAVAGSKWALFTAECAAGGTICSAHFLRKGEPPKRISVTIGPEMDDEAVKAAIVRQLAAFE